MELSASLRDVVVTDASGRALPLVSDEQVVSTGELPPPPAAPPEFRLPFLAAGMGFGAVLLRPVRGSAEASTGSMLPSRPRRRRTDRPNVGSRAV